MNNTTTRTKAVAIVAMFMAATLVVGGALAAVTTPAAFAFKKREDVNNENGNIITPQEINSKSSASGIDGTDETQNENEICNHPNHNATCSQEGINQIPISPQQQQTTLTSVIGQGQGQNFCPGATQSQPASIIFSAHSGGGGTVQGQFNLLVPVSAVGSFTKTGTLDSVQITGNSFTATGTEFSQTPVRGCALSQFPSSATISGQCGTGVTIQFTTADGEHATFIGTVTCT